MLKLLTCIGQEVIETSYVTSTAATTRAKKIGYATPGAGATCKTEITAYA